MGFLTPSTDERIRNNLKLLKKTKILIEDIEKKLKSGISPKEFQDLYEKEFKYAMKMTDIFDHIMWDIDKLDPVEDAFLIRRFKREAESIFQPIYIEV